MKKQLLLFCSVASVTLASAQCSELFFSKYVCASGNDKAVEIYNPTANTITLTGTYQVSMYDNGATSPSVSHPLIGTIASGATFVFCNGQVTIDSVFPAPPSTPYATYPCDTALQNHAQQLDSAHFYAFSYFNGDDALTLDKNISGNWTTVDIFACIGEWPISSTGSHVGWWNSSPYNNATTGHSWTKYHTLQRKSTVKQGVTQNPAPGSWNVSVEWDSLPNKTFPTGSHSCACISGVEEFTNDIFVNVFPNPVNSGIINIAAVLPVKQIQIYNLIGKLVYEEKMNSSAPWISVNVPNLAPGAYILKSSFGENKGHISKLMVQ